MKIWETGLSLPSISICPAEDLQRCKYKESHRRQTTHKLPCLYCPPMRNCLETFSYRSTMLDLEPCDWKCSDVLVLKWPYGYITRHRRGPQFSWCSGFFKWPYGYITQERSWVLHNLARYYFSTNTGCRKLQICHPTLVMDWGLSCLPSHSQDTPLAGH